MRGGTEYSVPPLISQKEEFVMGLDAYIEVRAYDKKTHTKMLEMEISYFRKYRHLQAFMEDLYYNKYNGEELFNTVPLELEKSDILDLEDSCRRNMEEYSDASGFFWGQRDFDGEFGEKEKILKTIKWCKIFLEANEDPDEELEYVIIYNCWW